MMLILSSGGKVPEKEPCHFECPVCGCHFKTDNYKRQHIFYQEHINNMEGTYRMHEKHIITATCPNCTTELSMQRMPSKKKVKK